MPLMPPFCIGYVATYIVGVVETESTVDKLRYKMSPYSNTSNLCAL